MSLTIQSGCSRATAVSFLPAKTAVTATSRRMVEYGHRDLVERIAVELGIPLSSLCGRLRP